MDKSGTYAAFEQMIQMSFMMMQLTALDQILEKFEQNGRLTQTEHKSLLEFARRQWNVNRWLPSRPLVGHADSKLHSAA